MTGESSPASSGKRNKSVAFDNDDESDKESFSSSTKDKGWSDAGLSDITDFEDNSDTESTTARTPPAKHSPAPASILKNSSKKKQKATPPRPTSPASNLANMVKKSLNIEEKKKKGAAFEAASSSLKLNLIKNDYTWKDVHRNDMYSIEVHLNSGSIPEDIDLELIDSDDGVSPQTLVIEVEVAESFLSQENFEDNCPTANNTNKANRIAARADQVLAKRKKYAKKGEEIIQYKMEQKLPFRCDNFLNLPVGEAPYNYTGVFFLDTPIEVTMGDNTQQNVLDITFVKEEKVIQQAKHTPSKRVKGKKITR